VDPAGPSQPGAGADDASARIFRGLAREARAWVQAPSAGGLAELQARAREATARVPEGRRADWEKLVAGFEAGPADARQRARVEGLVRACRLFEREARQRARREQPLAWTDPVERADGLGPASRDKLAAFGVTTVADLVWTLPVGWDDLAAPVGVAGAVERARAAVAALEPPPRQCVVGLVRSATLLRLRGGRPAVRLVLADEAGSQAAVQGARRHTADAASLDAWWFFAAHGVLATARPGTRCLLVGRLRADPGKRPSLAHPDLLRDDEGVRGVRARYPAMGVAPAILRRAVADAVARVAPLPDPVPAAVAAREGMPDAAPLLRAVHGARPETPPAEARRALAERLAWVEAFTRVWQRLLADAEWRGARAPVLARSAEAQARFAAALGFALTGAQARAIDAIARDLDGPVPMRRLLLGDVGTGKTAVALAAAAQCVTAGYQCALLVPTTVLADQYQDAAAPLERALGARVERVAAGMRAAERRAVLASIASGEAQVVVGTHALLQQDVTFRRLGLVVVDEQQRLGVAQRLSLVRKGEAIRPHLLSLSATPIPRTLALALRGELAHSVLDEHPRGRTAPATELHARADLEGVLRAMRETCARGERAFFVCPRIEDDEEAEEQGVDARAEWLTAGLAPVRVARVHGAMRPAERAAALLALRRGEAQVLVGTTVVEVGIDVPEATLMVIDGAASFGLAQLHQLRGRVGRGAQPGRCLLLHDEPLEGLARERLQTLARTTSGAEIARADLALRGAGDLGGTRQSGAVEDFTWLDAEDPPPWLERVEADARELLAGDPRLTAPEHAALAAAVRRFAVQLAVREEAG
jgi:ATP-dependent DNA helicase RecG